MGHKKSETPAEGNDDKAHVVMMVPLTRAEVHLIEEALDSHIYWQLSDEKYRNDGFVHDPGSDEEEKAKEIVESNDLLAKLATTRAAAGDTESH